MTVDIVLLGPPGAGKGTQAEMISKKFGIAHISSGDLFRDNIKNQTDLGRMAKSYIDKGELVPDDITISMVRERLQKEDCSKGALLDGFPRTPAQAVALDTMLAEMQRKISIVPFIAVEPERLIKRLSGRWTCRAAGHVYHTEFNAPRVAGICDNDGSELYQRDDDKAETVRNRIQVYTAQTAPLIDHYRHLGLLVEINGELPIQEVTAELTASIEKVIA